MPEDKQLPEYTKLAIRGASIPWPIGLKAGIAGTIQESHVEDDDGERVLVIDRIDITSVSILGYVPVEKGQL